MHGRRWSFAFKCTDALQTLRRRMDEAGIVIVTNGVVGLFEMLRRLGVRVTG